MKAGDEVVYIGCDDKQKKFGNCDDPSALTIGAIYTISIVEIHTWHTKISLVGYEGKFNSVCFDME